VKTPLRRVAIAVLIGFGLLLLNVNFVQVVQAGNLKKDPHNGRVLIQQFARPRGPIVVGGTTIARSRKTSDALKYQRIYPEGPRYAAVTGFYSFVYGATALERTENALLSGTDDRLALKRLSDLVTGREPQGGAVVLTLNPQAQRAAVEGLGNRPGAVVALDPRSGAVLAMASAPSYDPNPLATHNGESITAAYQRLSKEPNNPLLNRATSDTYPPGSLFKVVTAAAALTSGRYTPETRVPAPRSLDLPQTTKNLTNFGGESCGDGKTDTLSHALQISCNTAFGGLGLALGADAIARQAEVFGFGAGYRVPLTVVPSVFPSGLDAPQTAQSAIGQFSVRITPTQAAMIAAAVANHGSLMRPYLVQQVKAPDLSTLEVAKPEELSRAVSPAVADQLTAMMRRVVDAGTGRAAQIPGVAVAGKTGTAQHAAGQPPHAWFIGFAPADNPKVAVAVLVENGGGAGSDATGGAIAAPIARSVMQAVLGR
jgi:peptidoglycan glycosyltransferase